MIGASIKFTWVTGSALLIAPCLLLVVALTNYKRGDNPGSTVITV